MAGVKRQRSSDANVGDIPAVLASPFMPMFELFRNDLDEHHDRRERIIKASRDITALSKKMIFSLQRVQHLRTPLPSNIIKENETRQKQIEGLFTSVAPDLQDTNAWRYQRNISGGIQEYIEAISFSHYLTTQSLLSYSEAQALIPGSIHLTEEDYLLGLLDLVGELMRFAITTMATTGALPRGGINGEGDEGERDILTDLRGLRAFFEGLDTVGGEGLKRDVEKKMKVMRTCVEKVETAVYGMIIRGRERPKGWIPDLEGSGEGRREVESH